MHYIVASPTISLLSMQSFIVYGIPGILLIQIALTAYLHMNL
jgi:hypothetical protein